MEDLDILKYIINQQFELADKMLKERINLKRTREKVEIILLSVCCFFLLIITIIMVIKK